MPGWLKTGLIAAVIIFSGAHMLGIPIWVVTLTVWVAVFGILASVRKRA